jgi:hypothetical protein
MAEYKGIKGFKVQTVSTDPAASIIATGTWASGTSYPQTQQDFAGAGTPTAAVAWGGEIPPRQVTASYDGTSWTTGGNYPTLIVVQAGFGTQIAALSAGGFVSGSPGSTNASNIYNGSTWTAIPNMNTTRAAVTGTGTSTSGLIWGGDLRPGSTSATEEYDGVSWTSTGNLATAVRETAQHIGTQTAAMSASGLTPPGTGTVTDVQIYNGSSWSVSPSTLNTPRGRSGGSGTTTSSLVFGGNNPPGGQLDSTEFYDGTSWTELNNLSTARQGVAGAGTSSSSALAVGGYNGTATVDITEEWTTTPAPTFQKINLGQVYYNSTSNAFKVTQQSVPIGSWSSGGSLNTARATFMVQSNSGGPSGQTDAIAVSGASPTAVNVGNVELYDGSAWTETTDVNTARRAGGGTGGQPAAVIAGGYIGPPGALNTGATELWNGSTWTETTDLNTARRQFTGSFGTTDSSSDLLVCGAFPPTGATEIWNGSAWTEVNDLNTGRADGASMGTSTLAGLVAGGQSSPSPIPGQTAFAESWNGTSWTEVAEFNTNRMNFAGAGAQTNGFIFGGNLDPGAFAGTELWNGTSWTELNDLALARYGNGGGGSTNAAISFGGADSGDTTVAATEEWNAGAINSTLTAS